ncbi:MAG: protein-glutamate O-methyltransferase CheR [Deltaproteobacteria bacterium]|nr:protein-glutamate O-methyltransferase CheR [Deltaproteobacteria bacterium]
MGLSPDILAGVARRLAEHAGLQLPSWVVEARTNARIAALDTTPEAYVELIGSLRGQAELGELVEAVRVGESSLFRHKPQIAALLDVVVPALRARGKRTIRVWSAGCASGEEPYTLAIVLSRALPEVAVTVHATDVSAEALELAERGEYPLEALDDVPVEWQDAFNVHGDRIRVRPALQRLVTFERANLIDAAAPKACDVVWCRNVLIYFSVPARRRALDRLIGATVPGGFVFVGYSESLRDISELEPQRTGEVVFYMRPVDDARTPVPTLDGDTARGTGVERITQRTPLPAAGRRTPVPTVASERRTSGGSGPLLTKIPSKTRTDPGLAVPAKPRTRTDPALAGVPRAIDAEGDEDVIVLAGTPEAQAVTGLIGERLARGGLRRLVIDLDPAELLGDELAPVLRRACAAARAAGIAIALRTTRPGARRWLSRHGLSEVQP